MEQTRTDPSALRGFSWADYVTSASPLLESMAAAVHGLVLELHRVRRLGCAVFLAGNGGSASAASHLAQDLLKGTTAPDNPPLRAIALTDNVSMLTAYANDEGYDRVFVEPLRKLARPGDRLLVISCSGTSPNVVAAANHARQAGLRVIAVTAADGGALRALADVEVNAPTKDVGLAEALHSVVFHYVTQALRDLPDPS